MGTGDPKAQSRKIKIGLLSVAFITERDSAPRTTPVLPYILPLENQQLGCLVVFLGCEGGDIMFIENTHLNTHQRVEL